MGASEFSVKSRGKTAQEAFTSAVHQAQYEDGHNGYTGTIAEKSSFKMVIPREGEDARACRDRCIDDDNHFCQNKWGPAACIELGPDKTDPTLKSFIFFGWASC